VNNPSETIFLKSIGAPFILKTIDKICKRLDDSVEEIGKKNDVLQIAIYSATNCKTVVELLKKKIKRLC